MQLHVARLCLDCQEVHDGQTCPICGSETFAFLSRWVPAPERRVDPRPPPSENVETYRQLLSGERPPPKSVQWLRRGAFGLAALGAAAWAWQRTTPQPARDDKEVAAGDESEPRA
jgi:hypothetical protein